MNAALFSDLLTLRRRGVFAVACCAVFGSAGVPQGPASLPTSTGSWHVGTRVLTPLVDSSRSDTAFVRGYRTIVVQLWYPTRAVSGERARYLDSGIIPLLKSGSTAPDVIETWRGLRTSAFLNAPPVHEKFPLVLFSPGFGMPRAYYTSWIEELASRGFVVAAIDHPFAGQTVIDGRVFDTRPNPNGPRPQTSAMAADLRFLAAVLPARLGMNDAPIAAIGHSIGGAAALEACRLDRRIAACVNIDGDASFGEFADVGVGRPFMVIHQRPVFPNATPDGELARMGREIDSTWRAIAARQSQPVIRLSVRGTGHLSFTDAPFIRPSLVSDGGGILTDSLKVLRGTTRVIADYLRNVFRGDPGRVPSLPEFIAPTPLGMSGGRP